MKVTSSVRAACVRALTRELGDRVYEDADRLEKCARDFGRLVYRRPAVVASVHSVDELLAALRIGAELGMPISTRGSGHSQSGQCLSQGGLVLDTRALNAVTIEVDRASAWLGGGATWQQVSNTAFAEKLMPVGLTMIVDTTVGGTLSVGGVGSESFRTGMQVDQVFELDVATLDGGLLRCSSDQNRDLFDAVRAGLGQCGVIVAARYPLRKAKAFVRTYTLAYADGRGLIADMQELSKHPRCDFLFGCLLWTEQSSWQQLLFLGNAFDDESELNDSALVTGLHFKRELARQDHVQWRPDGNPGHPFFRRFEKADTEPMYNPWADHVCEPKIAAALLTDVLSKPAVAARGGVCGAVLGIAAHRNRPPLIMPRAEDSQVLVGLFPESSDAQLQDALVRMRDHNQRGAVLGGKRYLSGFLDGWNTDSWSEHFGDVWPWLRAMKKRFDPHGLLNNDVIKWQ